jgi:hypothetical protein
VNRAISGLLEPTSGRATVTGPATLLNYATLGLSVRSGTLDDKRIRDEGYQMSQSSGKRDNTASSLLQ